MKKLVTAADVKGLFGSGQKKLYTGPGTIVTPAARDMAAELGLTIQTEPHEPPEGIDTVSKLNEISPSLISMIVREVMASLPDLQQKPEMVKEEDPGGLRLVRGNSVKCEPFNTGNPRDKVGLKEILTLRESPDMGVGFMTVEESAFSWDLKYEEVDYVVEGTLEITVNGKTYRGKAGDVFYIPRDTTVTFSSPDQARFFFVTYPANWAELSKK